MLTQFLKKYGLDLSYFYSVILFAVLVIAFGGRNMISTVMVIFLMFAICVCGVVSRHEEE